MYVWFTWIATYKKSDYIRNCIKYLDLSQIVWETDAPYLSPQIVRKYRNTPQFVRYIYDLIAEICNTNKEDIYKQISKNRTNLYHKKNATEKK